MNVDKTIEEKVINSDNYKERLIKKVLYQKQDILRNQPASAVRTSIELLFDFLSL